MIIASSASGESLCYGTVGHGRVENAVQLPVQGRNYTAYSSLGSTLGRTYVHSKVAEVLLAAWAAVEQSSPTKVFVYGETGWATGGPIRPHRTHQNGLSVDFMVPVLDKQGVSVPLPTGPTNKYGYDIEFADDGTFGELKIDFDAIGEHLYQLKRSAEKHKVGIALVIFDPRFLKSLFRTEHGEFLRNDLKFMKGKPWVRHDEHYHVDFGIRCKPLPG